MLIDNFMTLATVAISIAEWYGQNITVPDNNVRVAFQTGMDGSGDGYQGNSELGGQVPSIFLEDTSKRFLGRYQNTGSDFLSSNAFKDINIRMDHSSELKILDIKMENDRESLDNALCVAYLTWKPEDSGLNSVARTGAIPGDLFMLCDYDWTYSGISFNGTNLRCGWLDGNNTPGNAVHGIYVNTDIMGQGYLKTFVESNPGKELCTWGVHLYKGASPKKRSIKDTYGNKALVTAGGGATELCDSPTSRGKSMLSLKEGIFCDMVTKTKVPLCQGRKRDGCFKYDRRVDETGRPQRSMTFVKPTSTLSTRANFDLTHRSYDLDYFVVTDINGQVIDDGTGI